MNTSTNIPRGPRFVTDLKDARFFSTKKEAEERITEIAASTGASNLEADQVVEGEALCFCVKYTKAGILNYYLAE